MSNWRMIKIDFRENGEGTNNLIKLREDFKETGYDENHDYWIGKLLSFNGVSDSELENGIYAFHTKGYITALSTNKEIEETGILKMEMELPWEIKNTLDFIEDKYNLKYTVRN